MKTQQVHTNKDASEERDEDRNRSERASQIDILFACYRLFACSFTGGLQVVCRLFSNHETVWNQHLYISSDMLFSFHCRSKKKMRKGRAEGRTDGQTDLYTLYNIHRCVDAFLKIASPVLFVLFRFELKTSPYMYTNPLTTLPTDGHALFCSSVHIR